MAAHSGVEIMIYFLIFGCNYERNQVSFSRRKHKNARESTVFSTGSLGGMAPLRKFARFHMALHWLKTTEVEWKLDVNLILAGSKVKSKSH